MPTTRCSLTLKKIMKQGVTPKTPKRLFPAGCCHSFPLSNPDYGIAIHPYMRIQMWSIHTLGLHSIPTQAHTCGLVGL